MLSNARGGIWTRTPNEGKGILSPALPPKIRRQRGESNAPTCIEAHTHPESCYHERYHVTDWWHHIKGSPI